MMMTTPIAPASMLPPSLSAPPWAASGKTPKFPKLGALVAPGRDKLDARYGAWFERAVFRRTWGDLDAALERPRDASLWLIARLSETRRWREQLTGRACLWALIEEGQGDAVREAAGRLGEGVFEALELDDPYAWYPRHNFPDPMRQRVMPARLPTLLTRDRAFAVSEEVARHVAAAMVGSRRVLYRGLRDLMGCVDLGTLRAFAWSLVRDNIDLPHLDWVITLMEHVLGDGLIAVARVIDDEQMYGLNAGKRQILVEEVQRAIEGIAASGSYWGQLGLQEVGRAVCVPVRRLAQERYAAQTCFVSCAHSARVDRSTPDELAASYREACAAPDVSARLEGLRRVAPDPVQMLRLAMRAPGPVEPVVLDYMRGHGVRVEAWGAELAAAEGVGVGAWDEGWSRGERAMHHLQCERLEDALVGQRRWSRGDFVALLERAPLAEVARALVWGIFEPGAGGVPSRLFGFDPDGEPYDGRGRGVSLRRVRGVLGLAHPAYLTDDQRARWAEHVAARWGMQPIAQLRRGVYDASGLKNGAAVDALCARLSGVRVSSEALLELLGGVWQRRGKWRIYALRARLASAKSSPHSVGVRIEPGIAIPDIPLHPRLDPCLHSATHALTLDITRAPSRLWPHLGSELLRVVCWLEACDVSPSARP